MVIEPIAQPTAKVAEIRPNVSGREASEDSGLSISGVKGEMIAVGELGDPNAVLRGVEIALSTVAGPGDHGGSTSAV